MNATKSHPRIHRAGAGLLSAALLAGGGLSATAEAHAASAPAASHLTVAKLRPRSAPVASVTIRASAGSVKAGRTLTFTGRTTAIRAGSRVVFQHRVGTTWRALNATTTVNRDNTYRLVFRFGTRGTEHVRVAVGKAVSSQVAVRVT